MLCAIGPRVYLRYVTSYAHRLDGIRDRKSVGKLGVLGTEREVSAQIGSIKWWHLVLRGRLR
jgi:hypothetical protein